MRHLEQLCHHNETTHQRHDTFCSTALSWGGSWRDRLSTALYGRRAGLFCGMEQTNRFRSGVSCSTTKRFVAFSRTARHLWCLFPFRIRNLLPQPRWDQVRFNLSISELSVMTQWATFPCLPSRDFVTYRVWTACGHWIPWLKLCTVFLSSFDANTILYYSFIGSSFSHLTKLATGSINEYEVGNIFANPSTGPKLSKRFALSANRVSLNMPVPRRYNTTCSTTLWWADRISLWVLLNDVLRLSFSDPSSIVENSSLTKFSTEGLNFQAIRCL